MNEIVVLEGNDLGIMLAVFEEFHTDPVPPVPHSLSLTIGDGGIRWNLNDWGWSGRSFGRIKPEHADDGKTSVTSVPSEIVVLEGRDLRAFLNMLNEFVGCDKHPTVHRLSLTIGGEGLRWKLNDWIWTAGNYGRVESAEPITANFAVKGAGIDWERVSDDLRAELAE